jgi:hypothetical protein
VRRPMLRQIVHVESQRLSNPVIEPVVSHNDFFSLLTDVLISQTLLNNDWFNWIPLASAC